MEAADSSTNSSKVIVQCHDPHNLFEKLIPKLELRLPLSKLHWKSPNRPLRSIDQLNVSFIRDDSKSDAASNTRRHQIPGLRQTPFVKVYLARCDDRELYKETCRKEVKQWLKGQGISQDGKNLMKGQERHDAYEYIILHVVLPGTAVAAQPKSSKHISLEASNSTDSVNSKSKWTGKSSSTVFDKLRADFSSSSKAPFERVAQVRIADSENKQPIGLGPSELEEQWLDLVEKLKTAILLSFDARVSQYEEDIRDREAQRQLPGWNFCTFFILKEGLARGFENVGLIEDALTVYDELDVGLDNLVQEQASKDDPDPTGALLPFSTDLKPTIRSALDGEYKRADLNETDSSNPSLQELISLEKGHFPFDAERTNYQQRILTNQVSALDFHIYIFTQQLRLLFRQAKISHHANSSRNTASSIPKVQFNLHVVGEICEKATTFITYAARALRKDLYAAWGGQEGLDVAELRTQQLVIGGIVASWKWSAIMQILSDCQALSFLDKVILNLSDYEVKSRQEKSTQRNGQTKPTDEDLALWVGELILMAKDVMRDTVMTDVDSSIRGDSISGLQSPSLHIFENSSETALCVSKSLSVHAFQCFAAANRVNASHRMLHALAEIELDDNNVARAVWWLEHIPNLSNLQARTATDRVILKLYAQCLKLEGRYDDYVSTLIALLMSVVVSPIARSLPQYDEQTQYVMDQLISASEQISEVELSLDGFATVKNVAKSISHVNLVNGFSFSLSLAMLFNASIQASEISLTISARNGQDPSQITLKTVDVVVLNGSSTNVQLISNVTSEGWYSLTQLTLRIGKLKLIHHFQPVRSQDDVEKTPSSFKVPLVMLYPSSDDLLVTAMPSPTVDLTKAGSLVFEICTGVQSVDECILRFRPATAGAGLDIQAIKVAGEQQCNHFEVVQQGDSLTVQLEDLEEHQKITFEIPYSTESLLSSIAIKIEAVYEIGKQSFSAFYQKTIVTNLPISVNVQDIFQVGKRFCRFSAAPSGFIPIKFLGWQMDTNDAFKIEHGQILQESIDVFPKMPVSWIIEAVPQGVEPDHQSKIPLNVRYQSFGDTILDTIEARFRDDMEANSAYDMTELLVSHLLNQIPLLWSEQDLEMAVLLQEFEVYTYENLNWDNLLRAFSSTEKNEIAGWLKLWHDQNQKLDLSSAPGRTREVRLSVEMPRPTIIISTLLTLNMGPRSFLAVGEAVSVDMTIKCTSTTDAEILIQYELISQPDTWMIAGKRKGTIDVKTKESVFSLIFIAHRTGHLLLPSIEIQARRSKDQTHTNVNEPALEVESMSQAKSILVIPNLQATTIAVGGEGTNGRYWHLDSRPRQQLT